MVGLTREVHGQPPHEAEVGVCVQLEAELADVEVERLVLIEHIDLCMSDLVWHEAQANPGGAPSLLQNCSVSSTPSQSKPGRLSGRLPASDTRLEARRRCR